MSSFREDDNRPDPPCNGGTRGLSWLWILLALALLGGTLWAFLAPSISLSSVEIPYSTFLEQVEAGNIRSIEIRGTHISGLFREPMDWDSKATQWRPGQGATVEGAQQPNGNLASKVRLVRVLTSHDGGGRAPSLSGWRCHASRWARKESVDGG